MDSLIAQETPFDLLNRAGRNAPALLPTSLPSGYCAMHCFTKYPPEKRWILSFLTLTDLLDGRRMALVPLQ